jgi:succinyl-CoA synthetase beta subunit
MKLYEYEGKKLFHRYGIPIVKGWLWNEVPEDAVYPLIAKVQVLTGGRGKLGGIQKVTNKPELLQRADVLLKKEFKGEKVAQIYIEETVEYEQEIYFSIVIDRNKKCPVLIVSGKGGVNIEEVPKEEILFIPINPLIGLQPFMMRKVSLFLDMDDQVISQIVEKAWRLFKVEQAELVEINPLFILQDGECVAGDSKVILDGQVKRTENPVIFPRNEDTFESRCSNLGTVGVELDGDIAVVTSGAGLGMATYDLVCRNGNKVRTLVDLGGHVIHDEQKAISLIREIKTLSPKGFLFNFFFQVASCKVLAAAIKEELGNTSYPVVVRLKGKDEEEASEILNQFPNVFTTQNLKEACTGIKTRVEGDEANVYHH